MKPRASGSAIVVGAGLGGLTAAAALARHFRRVTVLERDSLPARPEPRVGVPQGRHVHGLLAGGAEALETLFPGFACAVAAGRRAEPHGARRAPRTAGYDPFPRRDLGRANNRRAIMFPIEGNRWILGLGGVNGDAAPPELEGYREYARTLRTPTAYDAIRNTELQGDIVRFAFPKSTRRHFERMPRFPKGLLPVADAICRINPSFGQGMSVAAKEAILLDHVLAGLAERGDPLDAVAPAFFAGLGAVLDTPWDVAAQDYSYPHLESFRPPDFAARTGRQAAVNRLAATDASIHKLMLEVSNLLKPASILRDPEVSARIAALMGDR